MTIQENGWCYLVIILEELVVSCSCAVVFVFVLVSAVEARQLAPFNPALIGRTDSDRTNLDGVSFRS